MTSAVPSNGRCDAGLVWRACEIESGHPAAANPPGCAGSRGCGPGHRSDVFEFHAKAMHRYSGERGGVPLSQALEDDRARDGLALWRPVLEVGEDELEFGG